MKNVIEKMRDFYLATFHPNHRCEVVPLNAINSRPLNWQITQFDEMNINAERSAALARCILRNLRPARVVESEQDFIHGFTTVRIESDDMDGLSGMVKINHAIPQNMMDYMKEKLLDEFNEARARIYASVFALPQQTIKGEKFMKKARVFVVRLGARDEFCGRTREMRVLATDVLDAVDVALFNLNSIPDEERLEAERGKKYTVAGIHAINEADGIFIGKAVRGI